MARLLVLVCLLLGWGASSVSADTFSEVLARKELRVGISTFEPWAMKDSKGNLIGFEPDVARLLAEDMGVSARFVETPWAEIIDALRAGAFDVIISGMSVTPPRALRVAFSNPYATSGVTLAANKEKTAEIDSLEELNDARFVLAAVESSIPQSVATSVFPNATLKTFADEDSMFKALAAGDLHAAVASSPKPEFEVLQHPDRLVLPLERPLLETAEAMAVRHGEQRMLNFLNAWILARAKDGFLARTHRYWFKTLDWRKTIAGQ